MLTLSDEQARKAVQELRQLFGVVIMEAPEYVPSVEDGLAILARASSPSVAPTNDPLLNLLAVIHRDGGHYVAEHGIEKAAEDAEKIIAGYHSAAPAVAGRTQGEDWTTWGIVEIAVRNSSVADYCKHWEERAEKAEAALRSLPADWFQDSSLETWFPLTAEELKRKTNELAALRESAREAPSKPTADDLARRFHTLYEGLAPNFGYVTRKESAKSWSQILPTNKKLMIAVCENIIAEFWRETSPEAPPKITDVDIRNAKSKLYDLWCQSGSQDFTQWMAEKAIELFAEREASPEAPKFAEFINAIRPLKGCSDGDGSWTAIMDVDWKQLRLMSNYCMEKFEEHTLHDGKCVSCGAAPDVSKKEA